MYKIFSFEYDVINFGYFTISWYIFKLITISNMLLTKCVRVYTLNAVNSARVLKCQLYVSQDGDHLYPACIQCAGQILEMAIDGSDVQRQLGEDPAKERWRRVGWLGATGESSPEPSTLEECCWGPMLRKDPKGIRRRKGKNIQY
jgi:hypothetical protein